MEWARLGSNQQLLACETSALPLSYSPEWFKLTYDVESGELRDKESNPDLHVQSVVYCRLDDPGTSGASPSNSRGAEARRSGARSVRRPSCHSMSRPLRVSAIANDVFHASRLPFDPGSPTVRCALCDGRRPTWRSFGARSSVRFRKKRMLKQMLIAYG